jgi:predicted kinase
MFIIFAGLPGTGKSTIAQELAKRLGAVYLRIDTIEQAIRSSGILPAGADVGPAGYVAAYRVAAENLRLGRLVIADSVNPLAITRHAFRSVALESGVGFLEIEVVCSNRETHRERALSRQTNVEGLVPPSWNEIRMHHYEAWDRPHLELDTASLSVAESVEKIVTALAAATSRRL